MTSDSFNQFDEDDFIDEDPSAQLWERIAAGISILSETSDAPTGVSPASSSIDAEEIDPASDSWMTHLAEVQDWLYLPEKLHTSDRNSFLVSLTTNLDLEVAEGVDASSTPSQLTPLALEHLSQRIEFAVRLQQTFTEEMESDGSTRASATSNWTNAWEESDPGSQQFSTEPVTASADVVSINELTTSDLNLTPSYQRGDVWTTNDRQALIESVLRGIPLPSIILREVGPSDPQEVVDGKQRLTALLRFVGAHPAALERIAAADERHPGKDLLKNFRLDYPRFKKAWKALEGENLTAALENDYYFPFKLRNNGSGGLTGPALEPLQGKYYTQILRNVITVAGANMTVEKLFTKTTNYKVPVIRYTQADPRQIHDVFKLYNKQGVHLNAEEIRNAAFHEIELTPAILAAAGDADPRVDVAAIAPSLAKVPELATIAKTLSDYGIGRGRYRRTKILSWILSVLLLDTGDQKVRTTAGHIDQFMSLVQDDKQHPLRNKQVLTDLFDWLTKTFDLHARHSEVWSEKFMDDGKGAKWQELQLVGSVVGMAFALAASPDDIENRIVQNASGIYAATSSPAWKRIEKAQTKTQWDYIARIAKGVLELLSIDPNQASQAVKHRFGSSGYESLQGTLLSEEEQ